jgi:malate permease and related proteins
MSGILSIATSVMLPIFAVVGIAALTGRWLNLDPQPISRLTVYLLTPMLVFHSLVGSDIQQDEIGAIAAMLFLSSALIFAIGWGLSRLFKFNQQFAGVFILSILLTNNGNMGIPMAEFAFGENGMQRAALYFALSMFISNTFGIYLPSRGKLSIRQSIVNIFKVPLIYATILGLGLNLLGVKLPLPIDRTVELLGQAAVPGMLVVLGLQLPRMHLNTRPGPLLLATSVRLLVAPLIGFLLGALIGISGPARQASIMQIGMPTALLASVFAAEFGGDAEFVTAVTLLTTVVSIVTQSVVIVLLT